MPFWGRSYGGWGGGYRRGWGGGSRSYAKKGSQSKQISAGWISKSGGKTRYGLTDADLVGLESKQQHLTGRNFNVMATLYEMKDLRKVFPQFVVF